MIERFGTEWGFQYDEKGMNDVHETMKKLQEMMPFQDYTLHLLEEIK